MTNATTGEVATQTLVDKLSRPRWPIVEDETVYVSNYRGRIGAYDARTGQKQWQYDPGGLRREQNDDAIRFPITGAPARHSQGLLFEVPYVTSYDDKNREEGLIRCIASGATSADEYCWETSYVTARGASGSLLVVDETLVVPLGDYVNAYDAQSAERLWKQPADGVDVVAASDKTVVASVGNGQLAAFDLRSGTERWRRTFEGPTGQGIRRVSPPAITDDDRVVFGVSDGSVRAVSLADGTTQWSVDAPDEVAVWTGAALDGDTAYIGGNGSRIAEGEQKFDRRKGRFYALDLDEGSISWSMTARGTVSAPVIADDSVITAIDGNLTRFE